MAPKLKQTTTEIEAEGEIEFPLEQIGELEDWTSPSLQSDQRYLPGEGLMGFQAVDLRDDALAVDGPVEVVGFQDGELVREIYDVEGVYRNPGFQEVEDVTPQQTEEPVQGID